MTALRSPAPGTCTVHRAQTSPCVNSPPPHAAAGSSAASQAAAFASDPRVHFDTQSATWRFEDDAGDELEYDPAKGAWKPVVSAAPLLSV